eukprot:jgi/Tetstr1/449263/TSEL_036468.t2
MGNGNTKPSADSAGGEQQGAQGMPLPVPQRQPDLYRLAETGQAAAPSEIEVAKANRGAAAVPPASSASTPQKYEKARPAGPGAAAGRPPSAPLVQPPARQVAPGPGRVANPYPHDRPASHQGTRASSAIVPANGRGGAARPGSVPVGTVGRDPRRDKGYLARASGTPTGVPVLESGLREEEYVQRAVAEPPGSTWQRNGQRRPSSGGSGAAGVAAARMLREKVSAVSGHGVVGGGGGVGDGGGLVVWDHIPGLIGETDFDGTADEYEDLLNQSRPGTEQGKRSHLAPQDTNPGFGLGETRPPPGMRPMSALSGDSVPGTAPPGDLGSNASDIGMFDDGEWLKQTPKSTIQSEYRNHSQDLLELLNQPSEHPPGSVVVGHAATIKVEVEQRQWHLNAKRSVEGVGIAIDAIERRAAASAAQQKHLADASRTSALHRKTEADDLARRHSVAEQADLERTALAKKRATNIFSNEKARIDHQRRANEDAAKLERIRIDSAMKKVEDHMSDEQKRLRKESDSRIDQMVSERRVFMDSKKVELMANMEQTQGDWLQGLKEIEERQVDAMYGVQKAEQLMARRGSELEAASADASAAQAKLDGVLAAQADAKRALAEEEVALARTITELDSEAAADRKHLERLKADTEHSLAEMKAEHEAAAVSAREHVKRLGSDLHRSKEQRSATRDELNARADEAASEGEARLAAMAEERDKMAKKVDAKREATNAEKAKLRGADKDDEAELAAVRAKLASMLEAHEEQRTREVAALREQLRPQREKWETALEGVKGEVALREAQRSDRDAAAAERLGIKQAELDEAERRLTVHRAALEAEMVEALAAASAGFEADVTAVQKRAAAVEAQCAADRKKVETEAAAMREVLQAAQAELDKEKAERMREQSNGAAGLEAMKARIPVMEKEVHKLEANVTAASAAREALAEENKKAVAARREELQAELGPNREKLRKALALERSSLEERHAALEARRQGEQGEALRQMQQLEKVRRVATSIERTLELQAQEVEGERTRRQQLMAAQEAAMQQESAALQAELLEADTQLAEVGRQERARYEEAAAVKRAELAKLQEGAALNEASRAKAAEGRREKMQDLEQEIARLAAETAKHGCSLADKRDKAAAESPAEGGSAVEALLHKAEVLTVELGLVPVELELPLAELRDEQAGLREEGRRDAAEAAREAALVKRAQADLKAHEAVAAACLREMQAQREAAMAAMQSEHAAAAAAAAAALQEAATGSNAWLDAAAHRMEGARARAAATLTALRSEDQRMTDNRTDAQMAFSAECAKLADDEEALLARETDGPKQLVAAMEASLAEYGESLEASLCSTPQHAELAAREAALLSTAASLRSHVGAVEAEAARLAELADRAQADIAAGEERMRAQWAGVEDALGKAGDALAQRDAGRWAEVAALEEALQSKMEARASERLRAVQKKCMERDAVEVPRVQKITGEFMVLKEEVNTEHAKVSAERKKDAELVEAEAAKLSAKVAKQEEQVSAVEGRFAKGRAEVQGELAAKEAEVAGRASEREEARAVIDRAMADLDAAVADMESAIKGEKEKQAAFAAQLRKQARELLEENAAQEEAVARQIEAAKASDRERVAAEAAALEQRRQELEEGTREVVDKLHKSEEARKEQRAGAEERLAVAKGVVAELAEAVVAEQGVVRERSKERRRAEELLEEARTGLKQAELAVKRNRNVLEMEGSRVQEDRGVVEEDMNLELELLEQEFVKFEERVHMEGAKALEESMARVAELANEEHERLAQEWARFEEQTMHEKAQMDIELHEAEEELRQAMSSIDKDAMAKAKQRVAEERRLVEKHLDEERREMLREKQATDKFDADMNDLWEALQQKKAALDTHQESIERAEARAAEEARKQKLAELEQLMEAERAELQRREMAEMMEAMQIAEAQRAAEAQMQQTLAALEAQKAAFAEQAWQKQRAAETMRAERADRLNLLQRQLDMEAVRSGGSRPMSAALPPTSGYGYASSGPSTQRAWSAQQSPPPPQQQQAAPLPLGPPPATAWGEAAHRAADGWAAPRLQQAPETRPFHVDSTGGGSAPGTSYGRASLGSAPGGPSPELSSPGPSLGAMDAMGPGQPLLSADNSTTASGEFASMRKQMYEEFEMEKARMAAELRALEASGH